MRIGISILTREGHNLWSNGIDQNVYHLACLLRSLPFVENVVLLDCGKLRRAPDFAGELGNQFEIVPLAETHDSIDVAIEVSGGLDVEWIARFQARGGKMVFHICGQPYVGLIEPTTFNQSAFFSKADRCDEVWILPKDMPFLPMVKAIHRCPVREVPYLWAPVFLDYNASLVKQDGGDFGYKPGSLAAGHVEPAIFEPNISVIKTGVVPFLICEQIEKSEPDTIKSVYFMNSAQFASHPTFVSLVGHSHLYKKGKALLFKRDYFASIMGRGANLVVSHQIMCSQNYLYLDTLYGGYPLIHNSPLFADVGYYYPDSDIEAGAEQVRRAIHEHDRHFDFYQQQSLAKIESLSPNNARNQDIYARHLLALAGTQRVRR